MPYGMGLRALFSVMLFVLHPGTPRGAVAAEETPGESVPVLECHVDAECGEGMGCCYVCGDDPDACVRTCLPLGPEGACP